MPVHTNSIGEFEFLSIEGQIFRRQQHFELIERPGVAGTGLRRLGQRGQPFEVVTTNYVENFAEAKAQMELFLAEAATSDVPVDLIRHSVNHGTYFILEVRERTERAIFNALGGFDGGEECLHEVVWKLLG